ncbi:BACON domain-containing protein, partial [Bacteroides gallinaceum]|uniref:BACON domain-containing protein n=1 Tax=Bacteroides gallinaceum TaxID=1462571 RepID=UPI00195EBB6E
VSPASFDLSNEATSVNVSIETNTKYTVSSSAVWLVSPVSGLTESNSLAFDVAANEETSVREATLTFTSEDGSITRTVTVTQAGKE